MSCGAIDLGIRSVEIALANRSFIERYFELLKNAKVKGYLFAQQNYNDMDASKPAA
jgi:hypothetical protein